LSADICLAGYSLGGIDVLAFSLNPSEANTMKFLKWVSLLVFVIFLLGCSKSGEEDPEHFASTQQRALEKSKEVEGLLQETEEKRRKQMEEAER